MNLRSFLLVVLVCAGTSANAQLENASFESAGDQWLDPCQHAEYLAGGAPSSGDMYASMPLFYQGSSCDTNTAGMIYQKLPEIQDSDYVSVYYWHKGTANLSFNQPLVRVAGLYGYVHGASGLLTHNYGGAYAWPASATWQGGGYSIFWELEPGDTAVVAFGGYGLNGVQGTIDFDNIQVTIEDITIGVHDVAMPDAAALYPDPVQDRVSIRTAAPLTRVLLYTADGKLLNAYGPVTDLDLSALPPGAYMLDLRTANGRVVRRLIKANVGE